MTVFDPADFETITQNLSRALDGYNGGSYAPTAALTIGGQGIQDANASLVAVTAGSDFSLTGVTAHRVVLYNGHLATNSITVRFNSDAVGTQRIVYIDKVNGGVYISIENQNGSEAVGSPKTISETAEGVFIVIERTNGATWSVVHVGANISTADYRSITAGSLQSSPSALTLLYRHTVVTGKVTGTRLFTLPSFAGQGSRRTLRFLDGMAYGASGVTLQFSTTTDLTGLFATHTVGASGSAGFTLEFEKVSSTAWNLVESTEPRTRERETFVTSNVGAPIVLDPAKYSHVRITTPVVGGPPPLQVHFPAPEQEGWDMFVIFDEFKNDGSVVAIFAGIDSAGIVQSILVKGTPLYDLRRYSRNNLDESGGLDVTFWFKAIDGVWRHMGVLM